MSEIGNKIRITRLARNISLRELARRVDLSAAFLSDIERGNRYPSVTSLKKIGLALSVDSLNSIMLRDKIKQLSASLYVVCNKPCTLHVVYRNERGQNLRIGGNCILPLNHSGQHKIKIPGTSAHVTY